MTKETRNILAAVGIVAGLVAGALVARWLIQRRG
jgi:Na+/glutamate symporter